MKENNSIGNYKELGTSNSTQNINFFVVQRFEYK